MKNVVEKFACNFEVYKKTDNDKCYKIYYDENGNKKTKRISKALYEMFRQGSKVYTVK